MVLLTLGQRTLHFETYFMPSPEENRQEVFHYLLRKNAKLYGISFGVGSEDAVYLSKGQISSEALDDDTLDWVIGTIYSAVEECFKPSFNWALQAVSEAELLIKGHKSFRDLTLSTH